MLSLKQAFLEIRFLFLALWSWENQTSLGLFSHLGFILKSNIYSFIHSFTQQILNILASDTLSTKDIEVNDLMSDLEVVTGYEINIFKLFKLFWLNISPYHNFLSLYLLIFLYSSHHHMMCYIFRYLFGMGRELISILLTKL